MINVKRQNIPRPLMKSNEVSWPDLIDCQYHGSSNVDPSHTMDSMPPATSNVKVPRHEYHPHMHKRRQPCRYRTSESPNLVLEILLFLSMIRKPSNWTRPAVVRSPVPRESLQLISVNLPIEAHLQASPSFPCPNKKTQFVEEAGETKTPLFQI